jgi:drug/metabolite transporter (DMT)-like permease
LVKSAFIFNAFQSFWSALLSLVTVFIFSGPHWKGYDFWALVGLASLTIGSTMIAFALQVKAQKTLSPSLSSLLFLLESPFAMLFGILLLHETLSLGQTVGAVLIFLSAYGAVHFERKK